MKTGVVVQVGDFKLEKKRRSYFDRNACKHMNLELNENGYTVKCLDCNTQLSAYFVLEMMIDSIEQERQCISVIKQKLKEERAGITYLRAAKHLESIWRGRDSIPACPHCNKGITAEDALKINRVSKSLHLQKIKNEIQK